jgi:hypothetical protein
MLDGAATGNEMCMTDPSRAVLHVSAAHIANNLKGIARYLQVLASLVTDLSLL